MSKAFPKQFETVRGKFTADSISLAFYASAQVFLAQAFSFVVFDGEEAVRQILFNRNSVLHGRDNPAKRENIDPIRLFNAISTLTILDFLLEE